MFESSLSMAVTDWGNKTQVDPQYFQCWQPLAKHFNPALREPEAKSEFLKTMCSVVFLFVQMIEMPVIKNSQKSTGSPCIDIKLQLV